MSFLENIKEFFQKAQETNFDLVQIYSQTPQGVYSVLAVCLIILLVVIFLIRRSLKISSALGLVNKIQNSKDFEEYNSKLSLLAKELPKRGVKVAQSLNLQKEEILNKKLDLIKNSNIKDKIFMYEQISLQYEMIAKNSKKYNIEDLTSFYEKKSKSLLEVDLYNEIQEYYTNSAYNENDVDFVNSIVTYANKTNDSQNIVSSMQEHIDKLSYGYNLELYKFLKALDEQNSKQVYETCTKKFDSLLKKGNISELILSYMLEIDEKEKVYEYIKNLDDKNHLENLYHNLFGKKDDINLDLSFVANETEIDSDYASHLDNELTKNWKDLAYINHIMEAPNVLENIGHISYRNVLERIEKLEKDEELNKTVAQALEIARRAESIAIETKSLISQK